ncbi:retrotransposon protein, putative, ty1-copia subclass [Tanacetum coccineum]
MALIPIVEYLNTYSMGVDLEFLKRERDIRVIRILLAIAAFYDYEIWQIDVKTAFLNGHLSEDVYMVQPEGFVDPKHPNKVCKLQRSIYGLKQASRSWNKIFDVKIKKIGFTQNPDESCVYLKACGSNVAFLILYVDDIFLIGNNVTMPQEVKSWLSDDSFQTNKDDTKSQTGYVFVLNGGAVDWKSTKQNTTIMSSTEAEYIAAAEA